MEFSAPISLVTPAGTLAMNGGGDWLKVTSLEGFDDAEHRTQIDNLSVDDGALVGRVFLGALHGTIEGYIKSSTVSDRNSKEATLRSYLDSIRLANGTFTITETGQAAKSLTVRKDTPLMLSPLDGVLHKFQFGLVAGNPVWS